MYLHVKIVELNQWYKCMDHTGSIQTTQAKQLYKICLSVIIIIRRRLKPIKICTAILYNNILYGFKKKARVYIATYTHNIYGIRKQHTVAVNEYTQVW